MQVSQVNLFELGQIKDWSIHSVNLWCEFPTKDQSKHETHWSIHTKDESKCETAPFPHSMSPGSTCPGLQC